MAEVIVNGAKRFATADGQSLLDAGRAAGITLPYSCQRGRCSSCRVRVLSGSTVALTPETGLSEADRAQGWVLSCVRAATSDLSIEAAEARADLPAARMLPCRIDHLERLAPDVLGVWLRLPPTADFTYLPGQYIDVIGPEGMRRSYSLARACRAGESLALQIRAVPGGEMSGYWFERARSNDLLRLNGPLGTFCLGDCAALHLQFLATGTGIAPVLAMLESLPTLAPDLRPVSVSVYWGARIAPDLYLDVGAMDGGYDVIPVLSRAGADWRGERGYVQQAMLRAMPDLSKAAVYACGSGAMIESAREAAIGAGLPAARFHSDAFVGTGAS